MGPGHSPSRAHCPDAADVFTLSMAPLPAGMSRGFGFVHMADEQAASTAKEVGLVLASISGFMVSLF